MLFQVGLDPQDYGRRTQIADRGEKPFDEHNQLRKFVPELKERTVRFCRRFEQRRAGSALTGRFRGV